MLPTSGCRWYSSIHVQRGSIRRTDVRLTSSSLMHEMATRQVVLLGETHTIAEIHRWQLHVATIIRFIRRNVAVGFEMFPRRVQPVLDEWVAGELTSPQFLEKVDWKNVWGYDPQLYLPLFHFCRQQRVPMLALNCNRPLVTRVGKDGWDAVPEDERDGLTPRGRSDRCLSRIPVWSRARSLAHRARIGDGSNARSIYPRAADVGSRLCLQHCAGVSAARSAAGDRHHRPGPSRIRTRYAVSTARSGHRGSGRAASRDGPAARRGPHQRNSGRNLSLSPKSNLHAPSKFERNNSRAENKD